MVFQSYGLFPHMTVAKKVSFGLRMHGIIGGAAFAFLLSLDNLPTSLFTAPIIELPMPVYLFRLLIYNINPIVVPVATLQIVLTLVILLVASRTIGTEALVGERQYDFDVCFL